MFAFVCPISQMPCKAFSVEIIVGAKSKWIYPSSRLMSGCKHKYFCCTTAKSARLRQAKEEAEREIAEYRAQMEAEFQRKVAEVCKLAFLSHFFKRLQRLRYMPLFVYRAVVTQVQTSSVLRKRRLQKSNSSANRLQASPLKSFRCF